MIIVEKIRIFYPFANSSSFEYLQELNFMGWSFFVVFRGGLVGDVGIKERSAFLKDHGILR